MASKLSRIAKMVAAEKVNEPATNFVDRFTDIIQTT